MTTAAGGLGADAASGVRDTAVAGTVVRVVPVGLACCAVEVAEGVAALPAPEVAGPPQAHVMVVGGTLTHGMAPVLVAEFEALPRPRAVVAFGACTISGGPYWDSYAVRPGLDGLLGPVVSVVGCPPRPEALGDAIRLAVEGAS